MRTYTIVLASGLLFWLGILNLFAQDKNLVYVKAFDQQMNPMVNISVSINGKEFIALEDKKATFHEIPKEDLPPKFIKINKPEWEAESWNYGKGTLEIIVRKKLYTVIDVNVETVTEKPVVKQPINFNGKKYITSTTDLHGNIQLPLSIGEKIISADQFSIPGYRIMKMLGTDKEKKLVVAFIQEKAKTATTAPAFLKNFSLVELDSISSLTVFYAVFKDYDMSALDETTKQKIDAKFYALINQLQKTREQKEFIGKISDSSFVENDVKNLLAQAKYENVVLDNFRIDFDEKIKIINQKLAGGALNLQAPEREKLLSDLVILERVLEQNESKFYKNITDYKIILASLKASFSDIKLLEDKLSVSEMKRLEERKAFRTKILLAISIALVFAILIILLIVLRIRVEKQKKSLITVNEEVKRINENLEAVVFERTHLLIEAYREMDIFLYRASHDLRSPICTITGLCNITLHNLEDADQELIHKISDTALKMDGMLKKLRMMSEVNHPRNYSSVHPSQKIGNVMRFFKQFIADNHIEVIIECDENLSFYSYPELIEIVLYNLVENALFFSSIKKNHHPKIAINITLDGSQLLLSVYDNGIGIEEHIRLKLWDMFFVGHEYSKGNGLGLYIVFKSAQSLNGKVEVQTEPDSFARFSVTIPVNTTETSTLSRLGAPKEHLKVLS